MICPYIYLLVENSDFLFMKQETSNTDNKEKDELLRSVTFATTSLNLGWATVCRDMGKGNSRGKVGISSLWVIFNSENSPIIVGVKATHHMLCLKVLNSEEKNLQGDFLPFSCFALMSQFSFLFLFYCFLEDIILITFL